ncbi:hypothetical protein [Jiangella endophytica]|uniref:hypothetical protein n=1 Tax=Jiangella endophytica TaxID=1623398 RepID=UPI001300A473|nr:hypothetical protein [Jiangella endophytica]
MSERFKAFFSGGLGMADAEPDLYIEACEEAPGSLADVENADLLLFRDEFAAHIRESSFPPGSAADSQWMTDEWLRDIWYDAFGPEAAPGDPYPVAPEDWGRRRLTDYMLHAVNRTPELSSPGAPAWLEKRGLTFDDIEAAVESSETRSVGFRNAPEGWLHRLHDLVERGLREEQPGER